MWLLRLLVASAALVATTARGEATDPLLLEYSDYYYDIYYGDYEDEKNTDRGAPGNNSNYCTML